MFKPLLRSEIADIVKIQLRQLGKMLKKNEIQIEFSDKAINYLAEEGFDPQFGARPLKRVIQKEIVSELSKKILANEVGKDSLIKVDLSKGELVFRN